MPFYVNNAQSALIIKLMKANPLMVEQQLIDIIVESCNVEQPLAESFVKSWRWNHDSDNNVIQHKDGRNAIITIHKALKTQGFDVEAAVMSSKVERTFKAPTAPAANPEGGKIQRILALHDAGFSNDQIIAEGFNKSTVYRQVKEYKERKKAAKN